MKSKNPECLLKLKIQEWIVAVSNECHQREQQADNWKGHIPDQNRICNTLPVVISFLEQIVQPFIKRRAGEAAEDQEKYIVAQQDFCVQIQKTVVVQPEHALEGQTNLRQVTGTENHEAGTDNQKRIYVMQELWYTLQPVV